VGNVALLEQYQITRHRWRQRSGSVIERSHLARGIAMQFVRRKLCCIGSLSRPNFRAARLYEMEFVPPLSFTSMTNPWEDVMVVKHPHTANIKVPSDHSAGERALQYVITGEWPVSGGAYRDPQR